MSGVGTVSASFECEGMASNRSAMARQGSDWQRKSGDKVGIVMAKSSMLIIAMAKERGGKC